MYKYVCSQNYKNKRKKKVKASKNHFTFFRIDAGKKKAGLPQYATTDILYSGKFPVFSSNGSLPKLRKCWIKEAAHH